VRQLVSCGRAARSAAKLRVRQPLAAIELYHRRADVVKKHEEVVRDELNVKRIDYVTSAESTSTSTTKPSRTSRRSARSSARWHRRSRRRWPSMRTWSRWSRRWSRTGSARSNLGGQTVEIAADEVAVELHAKEAGRPSEFPAGESSCWMRTSRTNCATKASAAI